MLRCADRAVANPEDEESRNSCREILAQGEEGLFIAAIIHKTTGSGTWLAPFCMQKVCEVVFTRRVRGGAGRRPPNNRFRRPAGLIRMRRRPRFRAPLRHVR